MDETFPYRPDLTPVGGKDNLHHAVSMNYFTHWDSLSAAEKVFARDAFNWAMELQVNHRERVALRKKTKKMLRRREIAPDLLGLIDGK